MQDYRPTPYIATCEARLQVLTALRRPLTDAEQREVLSLNYRINYSRKQRQKYAADAAYREHRQAVARKHWRENPRPGAMA